MKSKRIISMLLSAIMIIAILQIQTFAASPAVTTGDLTLYTYGKGTASFSLTKDGGYVVTDCGVRYGTSSSSLTKDASYGSTGKGTFEVDLSGLSAGTTYYYQAYAVNANNEWAYGTVKSAVLPGEFNITSPSNNSEFSSGSSVTVKWSAAKSAAQYQLVMKDITAGETSSKAIYTGTSTSYSISSSSLVSGHEYKIQVKARSTSGSDTNSRYAVNGDEYYFYISETAKPGSFNITSPARGSAFNRNSSVTVKWSTAQNAVEYVLFMRDLSNDSSHTLYTGSNTSYTIDSDWFEGGHEYKIHVKARTKKGSDDGIVWSSNSDGDNIYTFYFKLDKPVITSPSNNGTMSLSSFIHWNEVPDCEKYSLFLHDNVTGDELFGEFGYYALTYVDTSCNFAKVAKDYVYFSTNMLVENRSYTLTLQAKGAKSGYYTESSPVVFTFKNNTVPFLENTYVDEITDTAFTATSGIITSATETINNVTDCGFYYRKSGSTSSTKVSLGKPTKTTIQKRISGLSPNTTYQVKAYAVNAYGEGTSSWSSVTTKEKVEEPEEHVLSVWPMSGKAKTSFTFSMDMETLPDDAYLQFDNPQTGGWFDESYAASAWAFNWQDYMVTKTGFTITKELNIGTPGSAPNSYKRKVRAIYYLYGEKVITEPIEFVVSPNTETVPQITIKGASYEISGNNLSINVLTTNAVEKLKLKNRTATLAVFDAGYVIKNSEEKLWTITTPLSYYANKNLTFIPGNNEYGYSDSTYDLFISYDSPSNMGELNITYPETGFIHQKDKLLTIKWLSPITTPDVLSINVSKNNIECFSENINVSSDEYKIPANIFSSSGKYEILIIAQKKGYSTLTDSINVFIQDDTPIGGESGDDTKGQNPTASQISKEVINIISGLNINQDTNELYRAVMAMIWKENDGKQYLNGKVDISTSGDYGICQLNKASHEKTVIAQYGSWEAIENSWKTNLEYGVRYFCKDCYSPLLNKSSYIEIVNELVEESHEPRNVVLARSAYSMYNGGPSTTKARRWWDKPLAKIDCGSNVNSEKRYEEGGYPLRYNNKPWEKLIGVYVDEEKTIVQSKPGVIKIAKNVPVEVRKSADDTAEIVGRFGNGTNVTVMSTINGWLQVEGSDLVTGKEITGYVKSAYVSYDITPAKKDSGFIGTVNKSSINIGEAVTFTVNANYGSYDFRISFDGSGEQSIQTNYFGNVYNYEKVIYGVGERNASMSWYDPSLGKRIAVDFPVVNVWIHGNAWNSEFNGNKLYVKQVASVEQGNGDNKYGIYIKNAKKAYCYGEKEIDDYSAINVQRGYALYREWNVSKELRLAPGTYEYGLVAFHGNKRRECKMGEFTLNIENAETETWYVVAENGAAVYDKLLDTDIVHNQFLTLPKGHKVEHIIGTETGGYNNYVQIKFLWTDGYTYTAWVSRSAIDLYNPYGIQELKTKSGGTYTPSDYYKEGPFYEKVMNVKLTGNQRTDILNIALSQKGYLEGDCEKDLSGIDSDGGHNYNNYTEFCRWFVNGKTNNPQPWCAYFVSWCARQAQIPIGVLENGANARPQKDGNNDAGVRKDGFNITYKSGREYTPVPGDLFFTSSFSHVGIVTGVNKSQDYFTTIEGNAAAQGAKDTNEGTGVHERRRKDISKYYFGIPNYNYDSANLNLTQGISLFSLSEESTDAISYFISCYENEQFSETFKKLVGANNGSVSLEVPNKTGSVSVRIPIDESRQFVTLYYGGQGYENGSKFNFDTDIVNVTAIVKDIIGGEEYEFNFEIHKKGAEKTDINYATVSYYNSEDEVIGTDVIDFDNVETGNAPYSTEYVKFNNVNSENITLQISTESYYEDDIWFPVSYKFEYSEGEQNYVLKMSDGVETKQLEYTITRNEKSNDTTLQRLYVEAYDSNKEVFASNVYDIEDNVISVKLPYSTKYFGFGIEKSSMFADAKMLVNGIEISSETLVDTANIQSAYIKVIAEDGTEKTYDLQIETAQNTDNTPPVISVVGESGTNYLSGSKITEKITYFATDESWCDIYLSYEGEVLDELEGITENGNYTITATDVFGNQSEFEFVYGEGGIPITNTTFKNTTTYHKFYVTFEEAMDEATIYAAVYDDNGKLIGLKTAPCDGDDYYIINVPFNQETKKAKIFVWKENMQPFGVAETLRME